MALNSPLKPLVSVSSFHLTQAVHRGADLGPDEVAVIHAGRVLSNGALAERVARLAAAMRDRGVHRGDRIAIIGANSDRYIEACFATLWLGAVAVPVNTRWTSAEVIGAFASSEPRAMFIDATAKSLVDDIWARTPSLSFAVALSDDVPVPATRRLESHEEMIAAGKSIEDEVAGGDEVAFVIYTGGTTGEPKGVMLSHSNVMSAALGMLAAGCGTGHTYLHAPPLFHIAGIQQMLAHFLGGTGPQVILESFTPPAIVDAIVRYRVTDVMLVPTMLRAVLDHIKDTGRPDTLDCLQRIFYGAAPMPSALLRETSDALPGVGFVQGYGMTETALTAMLPSYYYTAEGRSPDKTQSVGRPLPHVRIAVRDPEGQQVEPGRVGEIAVRGTSVMLGYIGQPELSAATVEDGWLRTGDMGYLDADGFIYLVGRLKDIVITGGENVYAAEVEEVLASHPDVATVAVIGVADDYWGERVHAAVVTVSDRAPDENELIRFCRERLAAYKCPRTFSFRSSLPTSAAGKILKRELRAEVAAEERTRV